jgi:acyl-ACP thioesterase
MGRVFRHAPQLGLADVAPDGRVRLDALVRWLQDAAWADVVDSGIPDGGVWIVRRLQLHVTQFPRFGEQPTVETFCSGVAKLWAERTSRVTTDGGGAVEAVALWVHLDPSGNRPRPLPDGFDAVYGASAQGRKVKARLQHPALPPPDATASAWRFRAAELDLAGHVNNAAYWQVLEEELVGNGTPSRATYEIEHRAAGTAGDATVRQAGGLRWIEAPDGTVLATLKADHHSTSSGASTTGTGGTSSTSGTT